MHYQQGFVRDTVQEDLNFLADNLRVEDRNEVIAASGLNPRVALQLGFRTSKRLKTICLTDGTPVSIYGVADTNIKGLGSIWLLATPSIMKAQTSFLRGCRDALEEISEGYDAVFNYTDARNTVHHRWLKWCGFVFIAEHKKHGVGQVPFLEFVKIIGARNV